MKVLGGKRIVREQLTAFAVLYVFLSTLSLVPCIQCQSKPYNLQFSKNDITVLVGGSQTVDLELRGLLDEDINVIFKNQHTDLIDIVPPTVEFIASAQNEITENKTIEIFGLQPGHVEITADSDNNDSSITSNIFLRVVVANSNAIIYVSITFGWIYFVAWSVSFYPQIYINFKARSVVGLNFDFLALNIVGFALYSIFNVGLYWIPEIQDEYYGRHPRGLNPVLTNDVVFSLHAMFATIITIVQCCLYERAEQRVSITARVILGIFLIVIIVSIGLAAGGVVHWLDFLYYCSYIKLSITLIKYIPQAIMNYRRKSTSGWSIGNILLDFIGGSLSMLQMILNAYNYDDWVSIFGDPTKFGLGLFSVCFDIFFMLQHYVFYRNRQTYEIIPGQNEVNSITAEEEFTPQTDLPSTEDDPLV